jgi:hypothetical protein
MAYSYSRDALLMVIADGMGGHLQGEVAAQIAVQYMVEAFQREAKPAPGGPVPVPVARPDQRTLRDTRLRRRTRHRGRTAHHLRRVRDPGFGRLLGACRRFASLRAARRSCDDADARSLARAAHDRSRPAGRRRRNDAPAPQPHLQLPGRSDRAADRVLAQDAAAGRRHGLCCAATACGARSATISCCGCSTTPM